MSGSFISNEEVKSFIEEYRLKLKGVIEDARKEIEEEVSTIVKKMVSDYYSGYSPKYYIRSNQLPLSVSPLAEYVINGDGSYTLHFDVDTDPPYGYSAMNHTVYSVRPWHQKKTNRSYRSRSGNRISLSDGAYGYTKEHKSGLEDLEKFIFECFLDGHHPEVGNAGSPVIRDVVNDSMDELLDKAADIVWSQINSIG